MDKVIKDNGPFSYPKAEDRSKTFGLQFGDLRAGKGMAPSVIAGYLPF
jgi:hypothetical protein